MFSCFIRKFCAVASHQNEFIKYFNATNNAIQRTYGKHVFCLPIQRLVTLCSLGKRNRRSLATILLSLIRMSKVVCICSRCGSQSCDIFGAEQPGQWVSDSTRLKHRKRDEEAQAAYETPRRGRARSRRRGAKDDRKEEEATRESVTPYITLIRLIFRRY